MLDTPGQALLGALRSHTANARDALQALGTLSLPENASAAEVLAVRQVFGLDGPADQPSRGWAVLRLLGEVLDVDPYVLDGKERAGAVLAAERALKHLLTQAERRLGVLARAGDEHAREAGLVATSTIPPQAVFEVGRGREKRQAEYVERLKQLRGA
jgi:hypothetical protein